MVRSAAAGPGDSRFENCRQLSAPRWPAAPAAAPCACGSAITDLSARAEFQGGRMGRSFRVGGARGAAARPVCLSVAAAAGAVRPAPLRLVAAAHHQKGASRYPTRTRHHPQATTLQHARAWARRSAHFCAVRTQGAEPEPESGIDYSTWPSEPLPQRDDVCGNPGCLRCYVRPSQPTYTLTQTASRRTRNLNVHARIEHRGCRRREAMRCWRSWRATVRQRRPVCVPCCARYSGVRCAASCANATRHSSRPAPNPHSPTHQHLS